MANQRVNFINKSIHYSKGAVLIIILIFSALLAMLANVTVDSSLLQIKMLNNFKAALRTKKQVENDIKHIEAQLTNEWMSFLPEQVTFVQFVPDTLSFGEKAGTNFYRLQAKRTNEDGSSYHLITTYSVRNKPENAKKQIDFVHATRSDCEKPKQPVIARLSSGLWVGLIACVQDELKQTKINIVDLDSGNLIFNFIIKTRITSELIAADSKQQGFADMAYMGDEEGQLWKIHFPLKFIDSWKITYHGDLGLRRIRGQPIVGRHPQGNGVLIYLLNENDHIHVIEDVNDNFKPFFLFKNCEATDQFILWQGYFIALDTNNKIHLYDAFSGDILAQENLTAFIKSEEFQEINENPPMVVVRKPIDSQPVFVVNTSQGIQFGYLNIDINRLGRRTFKSN